MNGLVHAAAEIARRHRAAIALGAIAALLAVAVIVAAIAGATASVVGALAASAMVSGGAAAVSFARREHAGDTDVEARSVGGPGLHRRVMIARAGAGTIALALGLLTVPAARRVDQANRALRQTSWRAGIRVVDDRGQPVRVAEVDIGELLTVWPEGAVGVNDAQAVLLREPPERLVVQPERADWVPEGFVAYSKLCTHMACPVGLYQQRAGALLCPCHQAVFDTLDGGRVLRGPATRPLPQLPLVIDEGVLVAGGELSDSVGTGFWYRP